MKFIVVTGGVISGVGKGVTSSTIAKLLQAQGLIVTMIKVDPYLNYDAGLMSPYEHGECFVLADGGETDLDLGNYERALNVSLTKDHNMTTGKMYHQVITNERNGLYLGATVQIIPHLTDCIIAHIERTSLIPVNTSSAIPEICVIEIGGTIGDIEVLPFVEALQQMQNKEEHSFCFVHVALAITHGNEIKTKPIQNSVSVLRSRGINPNILVIRSKEQLSTEIRTKLHKMCQIKPTRIISNHNARSIYYVPKIFETQGLTSNILQILGLSPVDKVIVPYIDYVDKLVTATKSVTVLVFGKYIGTQVDVYFSIAQAIAHACGTKYQADIMYHKSTASNWMETIEQADAVIIPGGFGTTGIDHKLEIVDYTRKHNIPTLGICLGMQVMVVAAAKQKIVNATSREWTDSDDMFYIVDILDGKSQVQGANMRLGSYSTTLLDSKVRELYGTTEISERHRHRYEVKTSMTEVLQSVGLTVSGVNADGTLVEIIEDKSKDFYVGCQFHPEFQSSLEHPHPLFCGLIAAAAKE